MGVGRQLGQRRTTFPCGPTRPHTPHKLSQRKLKFFPGCSCCFKPGHVFLFCSILARSPRWPQGLGAPSPKFSGSLNPNTRNSKIFVVCARFVSETLCHHRTIVICYLYLLSIIYYLLSIIYYLLSTIYYLLSAICYLLSTICYLLSAPAPASASAPPRRRRGRLSGMAMSSSRSSRPISRSLTPMSARRMETIFETPFSGIVTP